MEKTPKILLEDVQQGATCLEGQATSPESSKQLRPGPHPLPSQQNKLEAKQTIHILSSQLSQEVYLPSPSKRAELFTSSQLMRQNLFSKQSSQTIARCIFGAILLITAVFDIRLSIMGCKPRQSPFEVLTNQSHTARLTWPINSTHVSCRKVQVPVGEWLYIFSRLGMAIRAFITSYGQYTNYSPSLKVFTLS